jgi:hypothetical protein
MREMRGPIRIRLLCFFTSVFSIISSKLWIGIKLMPIQIRLSNADPPQIWIRILPSC